MKTLTNEERKMLTEFIGEIWYEGLNTSVIIYDSGNAEEPLPFRAINRTFLTGNDMVLVKEALEMEGLQDEFFSWCCTSYFSSQEIELHEVNIPAFVFWLLRPVDEDGDPHYCKLVCEFLKEKE